MSMNKKKELLDRIRAILLNPLTIAEIRKKLALKKSGPELRQIKEFAKSGEIVKIRGGRYGLPDEMNLVIGTVQGHKDGFGFVIPEEAGKQDVFIGSRNFMEAMDGDSVVCRVESAGRDGRLSGSVIRILERANKTITGIFNSRGKGGVIVPIRKRIVQDFMVPPGKTLRAKSGHVVSGVITEYPQRSQQPQAEVVEVLGKPTDPKVEKKIILRQYDLPETFPPGVEKAAEKAKEPSSKEIMGRLDLRDDWIVTIDGENAKDFDDAVSIKKLKTGFELAVHIADVSHYVRTKAVIDREAWLRSTSTYFPDSVIPMLPFTLSNNICSLRPLVDRLTLSAIMTFSGSGEMKKARFAQSVIRSRHRMTYTEAARIIDSPASEHDSEKAENLALMKSLSDKLSQRRSHDGSIDFDLPEAEIFLDMRGEPEKIILAERNSAHRLIEEFMLAANRAAAQFLEDRESLYRIHPPPKDEKLQNFFDIAARLGHAANPRKKISKRLQEVLNDTKGKPDEKLINFIMLRTMAQASYSPDNIGHFGLGFSHYTHFTSPIRRYPDLLVHRFIKAKLEGRPALPEQLYEKLAELGAHCSQRERISESAERDVVDALKVRFVADREGEQFDGIISGVTSFGLFVELGDIFVEGLVRVTTLHDDYYEYNEKDYSLTGKRTKKVFRLGRPIKVRIKSVDLLRKEVDLEPVDSHSSGKKPGKSAGKRGKPKKARRKRRR